MSKAHLHPVRCLEEVERGRSERAAAATGRPLAHLPARVRAERIETLHHWVLSS
jgi:hypothetical protein